RTRPGARGRGRARRRVVRSVSRPPRSPPRPGAPAAARRDPATRRSRAGAGSGPAPSSPPAPGAPPVPPRPPPSSAPRDRPRPPRRQAFRRAPPPRESPGEFGPRPHQVRAQQLLPCGAVFGLGPVPLAGQFGLPVVQPCQVRLDRPAALLPLVALGRGVFGQERPPVRRRPPAAAAAGVGQRPEHGQPPLRVLQGLGLAGRLPPPPPRPRRPL